MGARPDRRPVEAISASAPSFAELYDQHARYVWQSLRRLGVAPRDVEDVCQEVFVVVLRKLSTFDHSSAARTWIYGIALRCASDYRRHRARRDVPTENLGEQEIAGAQLVSVEIRQARVLLDSALDTLDEDKRAVFVLYELDELPMLEVAEVIGCPLQTAYSRLHAARIQIERALERLTEEGNR
jgi:RNA polymerase sigma-70 factor (ECF subfamily)